MSVEMMHTQQDAGEDGGSQRGGASDPLARDTLHDPLLDDGEAVQLKAKPERTDELSKMIAAAGDVLAKVDAHARKGGS